MPDATPIAACQAYQTPGSKVYNAKIPRAIACLCYQSHRRPGADGGATLHAFIPRRGLATACYWRHQCTSTDRLTQADIRTYVASFGGRTNPPSLATTSRVNSHPPLQRSSRTACKQAAHREMDGADRTGKACLFFAGSYGLGAQPQSDPSHQR